MRKSQKTTMEWALRRLAEIRRRETYPHHFAKKIPLTCTGETALWRGVILQAFLDSTNHSTRPEAKMERLRARNWLLLRTPDFYTVCDMADLDARRVEQFAREIFHRADTTAIPQHEPA